MNNYRQGLDDLLAQCQRVAPLVPVRSELQELSKAHDYDLGFDLALPLLPYQRAGVAYCLEQRRVILGDEQGLGKTPQLIAVAVRAHEEGKRSLIVVPPSLRINWQRELSKFAPHLKVATVSGTTPHAVPPCDVLVIGDAVVKAWAPVLVKQRFGALLCDEAHRYKNEKAKRSIAITSLSRAVPEDGYVVLASGTPAVNRPVELVSLLNIIGRLDSVFGSAGSFKWRYCDPQPVQIGRRTVYSYTGASNTAELHRILTGTLYVRRRKVDVLKELPAKRRVQLAVEIDKKLLRDYITIENDFLAWVFAQGGTEAVLKASRAEVITRLTALRQAIGKAKVASAIEHVESLIEDDQPVVVFAHHRSVIQAFLDACNERAVSDPRWRAVAVVGGLKDADKQQAIDAFVSGDANVFVGNYQSAGVGLTLVKSGEVPVTQWVSIELPWTPADVAQAEDRIHRIGQDESVTCWHITGAREDNQLTVDDRLWALLNHKQEVLSSVLDGFASDLGAEAGSVIAQLLHDWLGN